MLEVTKKARKVDGDRLLNPYLASAGSVRSSANKELENLPEGKISKLKLRGMIVEERVKSGSCLGMSNAFKVMVDEAHVFKVSVKKSKNTNWSVKLEFTVQREKFHWESQRGLKKIKCFSFFFLLFLISK